MLGDFIKKDLKEVIKKGTNWMNQQAKPDGSYQDAIPSLGAYYKTPYMWAITGNSQRYGKAVKYMKKVFQDEKGFKTEVDPKAKVYTSYMFNYMMAWVARGMLVGGAHDFAKKAYDYLSKHEGKYIRATCDEGPTVENRTRNIGSTSNAGISFVFAQDFENAKKCEDFVWNVINKQKLENKLFLRTNENGKILKDFPEEEKAISVIDFNKSDQMYWYIGISMALFGKMYETTREKKYLNKAKKTFEIFQKCKPKVKEDDLSIGKVAYGTALLYRLTGKKQYLKTCKDCTNNIIRVQNDEGYWLYERRGDISELNKSTLLDFCAEMIIWSSEILKEISQKN